MLRIQDYHLHLPHFHFDNSRNLRLLYAVRVLRDLVNKSALFFLPIFLFTMGKNVQLFAYSPLSDFQKGMVTLSVYLFFQGLLGMLSSIPAARFAVRIGHQKTIILSHTLRLIGFSALFFARENPTLIWVGMLFEGVQTPFFWNSYHTILGQSALKRHMGQDLGVLQFLLQLAAVIAPALGGMLALALGLEALFLVGVVGTFLAALLASLLDLEPVHDSVSVREFLLWFTEKRYRQLSVSFAGRYFNDAALFVWPLYVFLLLNGVDRVGYLYTVSLFSAMVLSFFVGSYIDRHHADHKPYLFSGGLLSFIWVVRTQLLSVWNIALVDMFEKLAANFHWLFFDSVIMRRGKGDQALSYYAYREIIIGAVATVFWLIFCVFFWLVDGGWTVVFGLASVGVLLSLQVKEKEPLDQSQ